jgi:EAL domain-containing protein (putative c-di-GMP-specific phosphodiesterase class I)
VDELKIDRSFVQHLTVDGSDLPIVQAIIAMAHSLALTVVAEGVEDQFSWDLLARLGCDAAQGYHLRRPLPAAELTRLLEESPWGSHTLEVAA